MVAEAEPRSKKLRPKKQLKERRATARIPLAVPVFARGTDDKGKEFLEFTTTLNVSSSGVLLPMRRFMPIASKIVLEIPSAPLPKLTKPPTFVRTVGAEVVRVTASEPSYLLALKFSHPIGNIG
ncbi:MAG TPA: PilZ domain-containing protein [Terriglobia bacterium]|nr:PilZ domain-containing protein [Terriglobia bacterium]